MSRLPILVRRNKVFELVVAGNTYEQICAQLDISEDTVARDMVAIGDEVQRIVKERHGQILSVALANYQWVIDRAKAEYDLDMKREEAWWKGELDYGIEVRQTKTLEMSSGAAGDEADDAEMDLGVFRDAINELDSIEQPERSLPLEVRTKVAKVRPAWRSGRAQWLKLIVDATREITELAALKKQVIEHKGTVNHDHRLTAEDTRGMSSDELRAIAAQHPSGAHRAGEAGTGEAAPA